ncbi:SDR family oxidoreductase [Amycolatopsis sp. K13G38]|uniref:SDR family oxidoreductase n=1 Tax=Amycolatopsis acididurans TaxID=2724524 RepID=A0ABX1J6S3_9PSEU|nr:SDR family oxidoreductase [Amycolatopsis acididurans]NKQ55515.1 SDR family oxidoreductase [Amycolatopsis acididurans]
MPRETSYIERLFGVRGKRVVVTGGVRGIGRAIAQGFVEGGAEVVVTSRSAEDCARAEDELGASGTCRAVPADLSTVAGCREFAATIGSLFPALDVLVNNAGAQHEQPLPEFSEDGWDHVHDVNVKAPFFLVQALLPLLEATGSADEPARVITVGSVNALRVAKRDVYAYSSSKAAAHHLSTHLAARLAPGITVNVLAPGMFVTGLRREGKEYRRDPAVLAEVPLGRFVGPSDVAGAALYLASTAGSGLTGVVIPVDCGLATTR